MERRDFLKISAITGASAALDACGSPDRQLIRFIPEEDLIPGIATWKPSVCTLCPAGCGLLVRVMEGDAEVVRHGQLGLMQMGLAKKLEGNPAHPVNQGRLCPRGQAGLQVTYHPDRVRHPLARSGPRGSGQFQQISWDQAMKQLMAQLSSMHAGNLEGRLAFVSTPLRGPSRSIAATFAGGFKNSQLIEFAFFDERVIRTANATSFRHYAPPTIELGQSSYVISFGANFLGTWNSPVAQGRGYGEMRQGHSGRRGKLVQFEPRISQTAANADEWIPSRPGTEGVLALSIAHVLMAEKLRTPASAGAAGELIAGWPQGLVDYAPEKVDRQTGVPAEKITRIAREAAAHGPAVALIGDAAAAHTNSVFNALAVNALNALLGSAGKAGGIQFAPAWHATTAPGTEPMAGGDAIRALAGELDANPNSFAALLVYGANPVFATPTAWGVRKALERAPFIASFGSFIDETSVLADLILPDHSPLESWIEDIPSAGSLRTVVSVAPPAMLPLHDTRAMPDVLLDAAHQLGGDFTKALPWKTYDQAIQADFTELYKAKGAKEAKSADDFWSDAQSRGGWWGPEESAPPSASGAETVKRPVTFAAAEFDGAASDYPFHFLLFPSQMLYDGSLAGLPWMQEAPDPMSSAMWGTWVELNPATADKLGIKQADLLEVASQHGTLRAPAMITPGIAPDLIAMPIGQGHENFTRYASKRGANPISILAPMEVEGAKTLAWAATRVKISRVGEGQLILFGGSLREASEELRHR